MEYLLTQFPTTEGGELKPGFNSFFALSKIHALPFIEACSGNIIREVEEGVGKKEKVNCVLVLFTGNYER